MHFYLSVRTRRAVINVLSWLCLTALILSLSTPTLADDPSSDPRLIESDDPLIQQQGDWTAQAAIQASGGSYLYSGGNPDDVLILSFIGTRLEIIYVEGPQMGILAIEVDGVVLRSVITQAATNAYQRRAAIDYLSDGPHTLRLYASQGVIGVDALMTVPGDTTLAATVGEVMGEVRLPCGADDPTHRVSIASDGTPANGSSGSESVDISADGRYVAFSLSSPSLVSGDTNGVSDIYVHDRETCQTTRVSVATGGTQANDRSGRPSISADGRYVAFDSYASNLISNDYNMTQDVFVHDRTTGTTTRISVASDGTAGNDVSHSPSISADGRYVAFQSSANTLVSGDTNGWQDTFVHDRTTGITTRVSVATDGTQTNNLSQFPTISDDGRYVAFDSTATTLISGDTNVSSDVFVHDRTTATTTRVSVATGGTQSNNSAYHAAISSDGRYVAFDSSATNLVGGDTNGDYDVFVHDRTTGTTTRVSVATGGTQALSSLTGSMGPAISGDGRYVTFSSDATNLVSGDTNVQNDIFLHDRTTGTTTRLSVASDGSQANNSSYSPEISGGGNYVVFYSHATNLVSGDSNVRSDIFVRIAVAPPPIVVAPSGLGATTASQTQINLNWTDNSSDETHFGIERSPDGSTGWAQIGSTVANVSTFNDTVYLACGTTYYYRVRGYRSTDGVFSTYSNTTSAPTLPCAPNGADSLVLARPSDNTVYLRNTLADPPPSNAYATFTAQPPAAALNGQWVMGDWDGDGHDSPGIYATNGVFYYTNTIGTLAPATWSGIWIGLINRPPVAGRFNAAVNHDCIGAVDSGEFPPYGTAFALYFTCDLTNGTAPALTFQWLSILLPTSQGHSGAFQFIAGDFDGNGLDSIAVRRSAFIAWTNVPPTTLLSEFRYAQYIGTPSTSDYGGLVSGDWDQNGIDTFGLYYQTGLFYRKNDLDWNSGGGLNLALGTPIGTPTVALGWH